MILFREAQAETECALIIKYESGKAWAEERRGSFCIYFSSANFQSYQGDKSRQGGKAIKAGGFSIRILFLDFLLKNGF